MQFAKLYRFLDDAREAVMRFSGLITLVVLLSVGAVAPKAAIAMDTGCRFIDSGTIAPSTQADLGQVLDLLADVKRAQAQGKAQGKAQGDETRAAAVALEAGRRLASLGDPSSISGALDAVAALFPPGHADAVSRSLFESAGQSLGAVTRQSTIGDTAYLGLHAKLAWLIQRRGGPLFVDVMQASERGIRAAGICRERKFFLRLRIAREFETRHARELATARIDELARDARALRGTMYRGEPTGWLALYHLTYLAVDLTAFEKAETLLEEVSRQAEAMAASGAFGAKKPEDFLESLPMYFRQERVRYFCPDIPGRPPLACRYSR